MGCGCNKKHIGSKKLNSQPSKRLPIASKTRNSSINRPTRRVVVKRIK